MALRLLGSAVAAGALIAAGPVAAAPVKVVQLPDHGRVVVVVPAGSPRRITVELAMQTRAQPLFVGFAVHGRRSDGDQPHLLEAGYDEHGSSLACGPVIDCQVTRAGDTVIYGFSGTFVPRTRIAFVWENAEPAALRVSGGPRVLGPDVRYQRLVTGQAAGGPSAVADAAADLELTGHGDVAVAAIPCLPVGTPVATATLRRDGAVVTTLGCPAHRATAQVASRSALWSLRGSYAGTTTTETRLLTFDL